MAKRANWTDIEFALVCPLGTTAPTKITPNAGQARTGALAAGLYEIRSTSACTWLAGGVAVAAGADSRPLPANTAALVALSGEGDNSYVSCYAAGSITVYISKQ